MCSVSCNLMRIKPIGGGSTGLVGVRPVTELPNMPASQRSADSMVIPGVCDGTAVDGDCDAARMYNAAVNTLPNSLVQALNGVPWKETAASPTCVDQTPEITRRTAMTEDERRKRHNENERRRTNAQKNRIQAMRASLEQLQCKRDELKRAHEQRAAMQRNNPQEKKVIEIVNTIDRLRQEKMHLERRVQRLDQQSSGYQTLLTEFGLGRPPRLEADPDRSSDEAEAESDTEVASVAASLFEQVLFSQPMQQADAFAWVAKSYQEIMAFYQQTNFDSFEGSAFGWRARRSLDDQSMQFMFTKSLRAVPASELLYKTWNLLTNLQQYRQIQQRATELRVLQRLSNDCVVVHLSVANSDRTHVYHTIMVLARGLIDRGYLVSYRSIPLSIGQQMFADSEGTYVSIFNWFMFLDGTQNDYPCSEVVFGGRVQNRSSDYLRYMMMEVVSGAVRWQTAVGHAQFQLTQ